MHPALLLEEILRIIFTHRYDECIVPLRGYPLADLVSLARTCRAFKEPALDVLWMDLYDLSQMVRCLPSACRVNDLGDHKRIYMLKRDLEPTEKDTVKAYARRVRVLSISSTNSGFRLDLNTLGRLCRTLQTEPLFPNLRELLLTVTFVDVFTPLSSHVAAPNLRDLTLIISPPAPSSFEEFMRSLSSSSLGIQHMRIHYRGGWSLAAFSDIMNQHIRRWTSLRSMDCPEMSMDVDAFFHLSCLPSLTRLSFTLDFALIRQIETSNHVFAFPALKSIALKITSMVPVHKFFSHLRLPELALDSISMEYFGTFPSLKDMIRSFAMALQTCNHELVAHITMDGSLSWSPWNAEPTILVLDDILPFTECHLTFLSIQLDLIVDLKDADLLRLASNCPRIESLHINDQIGWCSAGITPACLAHVLRRCPLLRTFGIVLDTRQCQTLTTGDPVDPLPSGHSWVVQLADSIIEAVSVPTLAAFFADCIPLHGSFRFSSWDCSRVKALRTDWEVYQLRWYLVGEMMNEIVHERSKGSDRPQIESL